MLTHLPSLQLTLIPMTLRLTHFFAIDYIPQPTPSFMPSSLTSSVFVTGMFAQPLKPRPHAPPPTANNISAKGRKALKYRQYQGLFKKSKRDLCDKIINGEAIQQTPTEPDVRGVFHTQFETESPADDHPLNSIKTPACTTWYPIGHDKLATAVKMLPNKAAGPDSFTIVDLKSMDHSILSVILNLILGLGDIPPCWKINRTILIPKGTTNLNHATNWRPLTISSVFVRLLHRILGHRLLSR